MVIVPDDLGILHHGGLPTVMGLFKGYNITNQIKIAFEVSNK